MDYISFPGLGIKPFHIDRVAFTIFGIDIAWYGIIICFGLVLAVIYAMYRAKQEGVKSDDVIDLALFLVLFGIIGARLYYIIFSLDEFIIRNANGSLNLGKTLLEMINIREGGNAIYGSLIAGFFTILVVAKVKKIKSLKVLDFVAPACLIGQIIGRWGNFVNVEVYGMETALPWRMEILKSNPLYENAAQMGDWVSRQCVHPLFLYESLWNLVGFLIINAIYKKKKFDGQIFCMYISWYGFGRTFIELLRNKDFILTVGPFPISSIVGFATFVAGVVLFIVLSKKNREEGAVPAEGSTLFADEVENAEEKSDSADEVKSSEDAGNDPAEADEPESTKETEENGENDGEDN